MPRSYPTEFRRRVLDLVEAGRFTQSSTSSVSKSKRATALSVPSQLRPLMAIPLGLPRNRGGMLLLETETKVSDTTES